MKKNLTTGITALAFIFYAGTAFSQKAESKAANTKTHHISLVKIVDGKKMTLDTVITGNNVLVWQGDTINPPKLPNLIHLPGPHPMMWKSISGDDEILNLADGDSTVQQIFIHKRVKGGAKDQILTFDKSDLPHCAPLPPVPPVPPLPHVKMFKHLPGDPVIDLNDPDILSYKKKDMSGGREKIEIIRKKPDKKDMTFEFNNDVLMAPDQHRDLEHAKELTNLPKETIPDGKGGKQIGVKVETDDNK